ASTRLRKKPNRNVLASPSARITMSCVAGLAVIASGVELAAVPVHRAQKALLQIDLWLELEQLAGLVDVGDAQLDVGVLPRDVLDARRARREPQDLLGERMNRERRARVADVEGVTDGFLPGQRQQDPVDDVVDVTPGADLRAVVVNLESLTAQGTR